ncbi:MAG: hypothetical protein ABIF82_13765 [Planctomycetota bacterium]
MQYKIVTKASSRSTSLEKTADDLAKEVNDLIRSGWKPQGGLVAGTQLGQYPFVAQAMVKEE